MIEKILKEFKNDSFKRSVKVLTVGLIISISSNFLPGGFAVFAATTGLLFVVLTIGMTIGDRRAVKLVRHIIEEGEKQEPHHIKVLASPDGVKVFVDGVEQEQSLTVDGEVVPTVETEDTDEDEEFDLGDMA